MSPELLYIHLYDDNVGIYNKEKSDIFSLGITFLRFTLSL